MAGGDPPPPAAGAADPEPEADAYSLLALADSELSAGRLRAACKHARRAALLDPACPRAALIITAASVLLADDSSPYAVLMLPFSSPLSPSALRRHFKSLAKSLRPHPNDGAASSPAVAAAAEEALACVASAFDALSAPAPPPATFWTACTACRLLHEFERKYLGYRLMCPSCRRKFLATEVPPPLEAEGSAPAPPPATKKPKVEEREMTLAEMQLLLSKRRGGKNRRAPNRSSRGEVEEEDGEEDAEEEWDNGLELMAVEDSDFYNFDAERGERCLKKGQVWALYGDDDGMPRYYAVVDVVLRGSQFCGQVRWLDGEEGKPCGQFKVGRLETLHSVNVFSHLVACERAATELYRVHPRKRSMWALREEGNEGRIKHEIVVFLSGYSELYGASFGYLKKVEGFRSIFTRRDVGSHAVHTMQKGDLRSLSHQIPARIVSKGEGSTLPPGNCWELDPASLSSELLRVGLWS
jgi:hypothetical protein